MIIGPRDPNVLLWLSSLAPADRLATMMALTYVFTILTVDKEWQREMAELRRGLQPTGRQSEDLLVRAAAMGASIKREMAEGGPKPVTGRRKRAPDRRQGSFMLPVAGGKQDSAHDAPTLEQQARLPAASRKRPNSR
jgi:hypothetical protein